LKDARNLTARQVAKICGVTLRTTTRWCSRQNGNKDAFRRRKDGINYVWPAERLCDWLFAHDKQTEANRLQSYLDTTPTDSATTTEKTEASVPSAPPPQAFAIPEGEMDIFATRDLIAKMLANGVAEMQKSRGRDLHAHAKTVRETAETLRKLELDALTVDEKLRNVVPISFVTKLVGRILSNARTNIMSLRYSMGPELAVMTSEDQIDAYLSSRFTAALRELESDFLTSAVEDYK